MLSVERVWRRDGTTNVMSMKAAVGNLKRHINKTSKARLGAATIEQALEAGLQLETRLAVFRLAAQHAALCG